MIKRIMFRLQPIEHIKKRWKRRKAILYREKVRKDKLKKH